MFRWRGRSVWTQPGTIAKRSGGVICLTRGLAGELVSGFLDGCAQRSVAGKRVAGDADGAHVDVDVDVGDTGELADLGADGAGAVVAGHPRDRKGAS